MNAKEAVAARILALCAERGIAINALAGSAGSTDVRKDAGLGDLEGSLRLRHVVDDVIEGLDCLLELLVLRSDESIEGVAVFLERRRVHECPR